MIGKRVALMGGGGSGGSGERHDHAHQPNRFGVIPSTLRLMADPRFTGRGVTIALIDSGFVAHPDLARPINRIVAYEDVTRIGASLDPSAIPDAWDWHGTQTSVVAAGNGHLSDGVYRSLAPDARVVLVKASRRGRVTDGDLAEALAWVIANRERFDIRVASISLGGDMEVSHKESRVDALAEEAVRMGIAVVCAAGNAGRSARPRPIPPANAPAAITVGGYDDGNRLGEAAPELYHSSFGPTVDGVLKPEVIAPAVWVAAPILPRTPSYRRAEALSRLAAAPDALLAHNAAALWRDAELPESLHREPPTRIRLAVEAALRDAKIVATHYQHVDGTSFAAPIVASVVAQMLEANPRLTSETVKQILIATAERVPGQAVARQGYGMVNARRAVEEAAREAHALDAARFHAPLSAGGRIEFVYHDDAARSVALAGDFNGWNPAATPLARDGQGLWRASIERPAAGRLRYKFVVDGNRWTQDPANGLVEEDGYGGFNSVVDPSG